MKLVEFEADWADEFDVEGFAVFEDEQWENLVENAGPFPIKKSFGTNQSITFETKEKFLENFEVKDITDEEADIINKFFPYGFGYFPDFVG